MSRFITLAGLLLATTCLGGCPIAYQDFDDKASKATVLPRQEKTQDKDGLNVSKGDVSDWKRVQAYRSGQARLKVTIGDIFSGKQGVTNGSIVVKTTGAKTITRVTIKPGKQKYKLKWTAEKHEQYYVWIHAKQGKGPYTIYFEVGDDNSCAKCSRDDFCTRSKCMTAEQYLPDPLCDPLCDDNELCIDVVDDEPTCMKPKGSRACKAICAQIMELTPSYYKGKYWYDKKQGKQLTRTFRAAKSERLEECVSNCRKKVYKMPCLAKTRVVDNIDACRKKGCPRGQYWSRRSGKCVKNRCAGVKCPPGKRCRAGRCVIKTAGCSPSNCPAPKTCKKGKCITPPAAACPGGCPKSFICSPSKGKCVIKPNLYGTVLRVSGTTLVINRGSAHYVKRGHKGSVKDANGKRRSFVVTKVFPGQCRAKLIGSGGNVPNGKSVLIKRR